MLNTGIYRIKNLKNGKVYIGSTNNFEQRKLQHFKELRANKHVNNKLQKDFNIYSEKNFEFKIIEYTLNSNRLEREQYWINYYKGNTYNIATANSTKKSYTYSLRRMYRTFARLIQELFL